MFESYRAKLRLRKLTASWVEYRNLVVEARQTGKSTQKQEKEFLALKASISASLPMIEESVPSSMTQTTTHELALITKLLNATESLKTMLPTDEQDLQDFERFWHERYMFLNRLRGIPIQDERKQPRKAKTAAAAQTPAQEKKRPLPEITPIGFLFRLVIFCVALYVLGRAIGVSLDEGHRLVFQVPTTMNEFGRNLMDGLNSIWIAVTQIMDPVIATYGLVAGLVMVGVLLLGIGYWAFVRG